MDADRPAHVFPALVRHFFSRFFDKESLSPQGEPEAGVIQTLAILATPGAFLALLFQPMTVRGWDLVLVRYVFLSFSMVGMGIIMVFEWDALFPDRRDYQVLTPQPLRISTLFLSKAAALAIFLGMFLADINLLSTLFWPGIDGRAGAFATMGVHLLVMTVGGLFFALALGAVQGVLITLLRGSLYRRVSVFLQTLAMALLVMMLFVSWLAASRLKWIAEQHPAWLYYFPGFWFVGLYEGLRPATHNAVLRDVGRFAWIGLACAATTFLLTFLPGYHHHSRRVLEGGAGLSLPRQAARPARSRLQRLLLPNPVEWAVFRFITQTVTRSTKHRFFLATYGGFGAAMAVLTLPSGRSGLVELPLELSFVLVSGLRAAFNFPSELSANWGFQLTETGSIQPYLSATRKWIVLCGVLPLFLLLTPVELAFFDWRLAAFHLSYGIALSLLLVEIMFFGFRKVPFTCAHFPGKVNLVFLCVIYIFGFSMYSGHMADLETWLATQPAAAAAFFIIAAAAWQTLSYFSRRLLGPKPSLDYENPGDPVVRTLGIAVR
jgi:hypothetical protein